MKKEFIQVILGHYNMHITHVQGAAGGLVFRAEGQRPHYPRAVVRSGHRCTRTDGHLQPCPGWLPETSLGTGGTGGTNSTCDILYN